MHLTSVQKTALEGVRDAIASVLAASYKASTRAHPPKKIAADWCGAPDPGLRTCSCYCHEEEDACSVCAAATDARQRERDRAWEILKHHAEQGDPGVWTAVVEDFLETWECRTCGAEFDDPDKRSAHEGLPHELAAEAVLSEGPAPDDASSLKASVRYFEESVIAPIVAHYDKVTGTDGSDVSYAELAKWVIHRSGELTTLLRAAQDALDDAGISRSPVPEQILDGIKTAWKFHWDDDDFTIEAEDGTEIDIKPAKIAGPDCTEIPAVTIATDDGYVFVPIDVAAELVACIESVAKFWAAQEVQGG